MSAGERWLRDHACGAPTALLETMVAALPRSAASDAEALAEGAMSLYRLVVAGAGDRDDALALLAADALLTHAFQAQAQSDPDGLEQLGARYGALGELGSIAP